MNKIRCGFEWGITMPLVLATALILAWSTGCMSAKDEATTDVLHGTIAYPFVDESKTIGIEPPDDKFVIKSAVGNAEYQIQIPGGARDFDVQIPISELDREDRSKPRDLANPTQTDKEVVASLPRLDKDRATDTAILDSAFGTAAADGPRQAPSYTLGMARINAYYKQRQFEYALVEINALLAFYANSPQLHKMKGTVLLKIRNLALAETAWSKALQLNPRDQALQRALERLQKRLAAQGGGKNSAGASSNPQAPGAPLEFEKALDP